MQGLTATMMSLSIAAASVTSPGAAHAQGAAGGDRTRADSLASASVDRTRADSLASASVDRTHADSLTSPAPTPTTPAARASEPTDSRTFTFWNYPEPERRTPLPFADQPAPRTYPEVTAGFGLGWYGSSFKGVEKAFGAIEDTVRRGGHAIAAAGSVPSQDVSLLTLRVSVTPRLGASFQLGETNDGNNDVRLVGGFAWYGWTFPQVKVLSLHAGAGGGLYRFTFERKYGAVVTAVDAGGGYTTLDFVRFEGRGAYGTIVGEAVLHAASRAEIAGTIQYLGTGDVSSDVPGLGRQSVNLSACLLGLSLLVSF